MNKRRVGALKEDTAVAYLKANGLNIVELNYRCRQGEIDIICKDRDVFIFVEVKYRSSDSFGSASYAVDYKKQRKICRVSDFYRMSHKLSDYVPIRYDVIAIDGDEITWIKNAFEYIYR